MKFIKDYFQRARRGWVWKNSVDCQTRYWHLCITLQREGARRIQSSTSQNRLLLHHQEGFHRRGICASYPWNNKRTYLYAWKYLHSHILLDKLPLKVHEQSTVGIGSLGESSPPAKYICLCKSSCLNVLFFSKQVKKIRQCSVIVSPASTSNHLLPGIFLKRHHFFHTSTFLAGVSQFRF